MFKIGLLATVGAIMYAKKQENWFAERQEWVRHSEKSREAVWLQRQGVRWKVWLPGLLWNFHSWIWSSGPSPKFWDNPSNTTINFQFCLIQFERVSFSSSQTGLIEMVFWQIGWRHKYGIQKHAMCWHVVKQEVSTRKTRKQSSRKRDPDKAGLSLVGIW